MAKFYGPIGYGVMQKTSPGVFKEVITEHNYYGDLVRNTSSLQSGSQLNDNVNVGNQISIVADPFANKNFHLIRYVEFMGVRWKVTNVEVISPRLLLTMGGVYNGN